VAKAALVRRRDAPKHVRAYIPPDRIHVGDTLMSTLCRPMRTFVEEIAPEKGVHDCHIPDTFDINMRYEHDRTRHRRVIGLPASRAGDHVEFGAPMRLPVALSVCPLDSGDCNGGKSTPVRVEVYAPD
jgi:uncharacterized protein YcgI (DUF1989 family)